MTLSPKADSRSTSDRFGGYTAGARATVVPSAFFSELLPLIEDASELRVSVYLFFALGRRHGYPRFVTERELRAEGPLQASQIPDTAQVQRAPDGWSGSNQVPIMLDFLLRQGEVAVGGEGFDPPPGYVACDHCSTLICPPDSRIDGWGVGMAEFPLA